MNGAIRKIALCLLLLLGLGLASAVFASGQDEARLGSLLNEERSRRGISVLAFDSALFEVAKKHSDEMARLGRPFHSTSLDSQVSGWSVLGENVGRGPTVDQIHQAFMASAAHREQILDPEYRGYAVGTVTSGEQIWVTELFILRRAVEVLGGPAKQNPEPEIVAPEPVLLRQIERLPMLAHQPIPDVELDRRAGALPLVALAFLVLVIDAHVFMLLATRRSGTPHLA